MGLLPISAMTGEPIREWSARMLPRYEDSDLIWKGPAASQVVFVRDGLPQAFGKAPAWVEDEGARIEVVGSHFSKSCELPVYLVEVNPELHVLMRGNFHDWKISVESKSALDLRPEGLFDPDSDHLLQPVYFEGFPQDSELKRPHVFPTYGCSDFCFSVALSYRTEALYAFFRELWLARLRS